MTPRRLETRVAGETVPGLLWTPALPTTSLVLIGHGRTGDKDSPWVAAIAQRFTDRGWNALAFDAPGHGERREPDAVDWPHPQPEDAAEGWRAALAQLEAEHGIGIDGLGYWGISMGAAIGVALAVREPRMRAAVLGHMHADWPTAPGERLRADAAALTLPVLFLANWDDTRVPRESAFEMFGLIGSADKRLLVHPGDHAELSPEAMDFADDFLARHL